MTPESQPPLTPESVRQAAYRAYGLAFAPPDPSTLASVVALYAYEWPHAYEDGTGVLPAHPGGDEVEATTAWRVAWKLVRKYVPRHYHKDLLTVRGEHIPKLAGKEQDWDFLLFSAMLLRYIALSAAYELRTFTPEERRNRTEREKRHSRLMEKWEVLT